MIYMFFITIVFNCFSFESPKFIQNSILEDLYHWDQGYRKYCELDEVTKRDSLNQEILFDYISKFGFPKCNDSLSQKAYYGAYYVMQHSNVEFMELYLEEIKKMVDCGKLEPKKYAMTFDRISLERTGFQIYGEQFYRDTNDNYLKLCPIRNNDSVQIYRAYLGLDTLDLNIKIKLIERKITN